MTTYFFYYQMPFIVIEQRHIYINKSGPKRSEFLETRARTIRKVLKYTKRYLFVFEEEVEQYYYIWNEGMMECMIHLQRFFFEILFL